MNRIALKMLVGDRAKYIGIVTGLTFASLLITQQASIFVGIMSRTFGFISDTSLPDVWVMDRKVQYIDDVKPLLDTQLLRIRGIEGVAWAQPLYKGLIKARLPDGTFQNTIVIGLDDDTLVGGPPRMIDGALGDLRRADGVIVDAVGAADKLAYAGADGQRRPLRVGDTIELNDRRAVVVGLCQVSRTFQSQPVIYTTYTRATTFAPRERKLLSFILVKARDGVSPEALCRTIEQETATVRGGGLRALTGGQFAWETINYYLKNTGIPINFGMSVILGFLVGTAIAGQTFYNFTLDNLRHFGALKAMGAGNALLLRMIVLQAVLVGAVGYGLGVGLASLFGRLASQTELAFRMPWQLLTISAAAVLVICVISAVISMVKVIRTEPAIVFKS